MPVIPRRTAGHVRGGDHVRPRGKLEEARAGPGGRSHTTRDDRACDMKLSTGNIQYATYMQHATVDSMR